MSHATSRSSTMDSLRVLGYANSTPAIFVVDRACPHSLVSASFLFQNSFHAKLESTGCNYAHLKILVPTQGGYYTSPNIRLGSSVTCSVDVVLGADWLASCRITTEVNVIRPPAVANIGDLPDGHVWTADERFLPFSLLHKRDDQYRFMANELLVPELLPNVFPNVSDAGGSFGSPCAMAGYHEQVIFDAACQRILPSPPVPPTGANMNPHDTQPEYNMDLVLYLLRSCLRDDSPAFWAKISHEHQIKSVLTSMDVLRDEFIRHMFSGACVLCPGPDCQAVVEGERWPQSMGICVIDSALQWLEQDVLSIEDLVRICRALGITPSAKNKKKSLITKLVDRRRQLLEIVDAASCSVAQLVPRLGSSSSLRTVKSVGVAHGLDVSELTSRDSVTEKVLEHVTRGECAKRTEKAPGCERVMEEKAPSHQDVVHLQISVLWDIVGIVSRKQLYNILDIHDIDYNPDETVRKLRSHLKRYIQKIEKGKLKDVEAESRTIETLRKLDEVRKNWPKLIPLPVKERIIKDFRAATSSAELATFTCACCGRSLSIRERVRRQHAEVNLDLLNSPEAHWNDAHFAPPPTPFMSGPLKHKLIDAHGVQFKDDGSIVLDLCSSCLRGLRRNSLPKHALANKLFLGPIPEQLSDLTMVEESMIARARAKSWIVKLQEQNSDSASPTSQRALKGHTIIFPQQPDKLATVLPPPVGDTLTFICVIYVGNEKLTNEWLREKAKPLVVRREKVREALMWLRENNPLYKDVQISDDVIDSLPVDDVLPYNIEQVADSDAQAALISRYDNIGVEPAVTPSNTHFESVVIADVDARTPVNQLRAAAVRHAKTKGRPFVQLGHGPKPVNEFFNVDLFPMLYPTLFPYGCGGFEDRGRCKLISLKEHVKYLFSSRDKRFQTHYSFLFTAFNILQRRSLLLGASLKVKKASFTQFARSFSSVSSEAVGHVLERIESGEGVTAHTDEERKVLRLMKEVNLVTAKVPGSSASKVAMRNEIRALTMTHGMPSFYVTINPADTHNPVVKFLAGADIDIDNMLQDQIPNYWEQSILISSDPAVGAKFFNTYLKAFLRTVLGYTGDELNPDGGVLGVVKAHYGCVEAQGRGSLHCHMLIWIEGALNPNEIRKKVMEDVEWGKRLLDYLDDTITNVVPQDPLPDVSTPWDGKDPCTLRGVNLNLSDVQTRVGLRLKDINKLAERVQRHRHSHTCYKYYKAGEARTCRFDLKEENFRADSCIDADTGQINLRCLDGLVNNFNATILEAVRCNMDIQFIGSGESAKAMIYYITDYITKSQLKSHVAYAALQLAVKKCEDVDDEDDDFTARSKRLLQKCAYAMVSHQEMSGQQVASYLMGYEDHFTSEQFSCLYWASFERYIERHDGEKLCPNVLGNNDGPVGSEDAPDPDTPQEQHAQSSTEAVEGEDESQMVEEDDDEEVSIRVDETGNVSVLADQVSDYTQRPHELQGLCLWDFVAKAEKMYRSRGSAGRSDIDEEDDVALAEPPEDEYDIDASDEEEDVREQKCDGPMRRYEFLAEHKEGDRKNVRLRKRDVIPVPIGPAMPRRDQPEARARYCRLMLILFRPWRALSDLRDTSESWETVFDEFSPLMNSRQQQIMKNMQVLHECRDSRNEHMQTRTRERAKGSTAREAEDGAPGNDLEEIDMSEVLDHLEDIDRMASRKLDDASEEAQECLDRLANAGYFAAANRSIADCGGGVQAELALENDDSLEDEWRDTYEKRKAAWKLEAREDENTDGGAATTTINQMQVEGSLLDDGPLITEAETADVGPAGATDGYALMDEMGKKWTLNTEQTRAFRIVARHSMIDKPDQLLMHLGGPGGTGKSRVVNALREFFTSRRESRRFRLAAYTGVAARNIGGATLHALLQLSESGRGLSAKTKRDLAAMWEGVDYLFIDEVSMIGCEMLHNISRALTEAKGSTTAFGGVNVIFAGDFAQLAPIGDTRLYKDVNTGSLAAGASNRAQGKVLGRLLWLSVETVVILHETMRQSGSGNAAFVGLLQRLRDGCCSEEDFNILAKRSLGQLTLPNGGDDWKFAPVIVTNNATRDAINRRAAEAFAEQQNAQLHWYHAIDTHKRAIVKDTDLIEKLEGQHSGQTKHRHRRIPLVIGMPVAINQNFDVAAGVVNGSYGTLRRIRYFTDREGRRYLKSCIVEIPGSDGVEVPHLPRHHFPIMPDTTELKFEHGKSHKRCTIRRKQVPIEPGFAVTVYKAQGQTMNRVIVDLTGCTGTEPPYVMVSRATSLDGLVVLRDFDARQITKRRSEDLRKEFNRLTLLKWQTIVDHGCGAEINEAKQMIKNLRGGAGARGTKRKAERGKEPNNGSKRSRVAVA